MLAVYHDRGPIQEHTSGSVNGYELQAAPRSFPLCVSLLQQNSIRKSGVLYITSICEREKGLAFLFGFNPLSVTHSFSLSCDFALTDPPPNVQMLDPRTLPEPPPGGGV